MMARLRQRCISPVLREKKRTLPFPLPSLRQRHQGVADGVFRVPDFTAIPHRPQSSARRGFRFPSSRFQNAQHIARHEPTRKSPSRCPPAARRTGVPRSPERQPETGAKRPPNSRSKLPLPPSLTFTQSVLPSTSKSRRRRHHRQRLRLRAAQTPPGCKVSENLRPSCKQRHGIPSSMAFPARVMPFPRLGA